MCTGTPVKKTLRDKGSAERFEETCYGGILCPKFWAVQADAAAAVSSIRLTLKASHTDNITHR
jgi:hypothetical protein